MIVSHGPRSIHIARPLLVTVGVLAVWDIGVTVLYLNDATHFDGIDIQFTLFGSAIALFLGFMVNAAYGRWWEARTLWGQVVNSSRSLARQTVVLIAPGDEDPAVAGVRRRVVRAQIAYVHALRTALRGQPLPDEVRSHLAPDTLAAVERATNRPAAILTAIDREISGAARAGLVGELSRLQLESTLVALTDAQGGLERIRNTPLPVQYRFLPRFFARTFCVILPFAVVTDLGWATPIGSGLVGLMFLLAVQVGDELAEPFVDGPYDVPMTALCTTIQIDLAELVGSDSPAPVQPVDRVLW